MNLSESMALHAGGPGSGRHSEGGKTTKSYFLHSKDDRKAARDVLLTRGFEHKSLEDNGTGRFAQHVEHFEHPSGHTAAISHSAAAGKDNFLNIHSKDDGFHEHMRVALMRSGLKQYK